MKTFTEVVDRMAELKRIADKRNDARVAAGGKGREGSPNPPASQGAQKAKALRNAAGVGRKLFDAKRMKSNALVKVPNKERVGKDAIGYPKKSGPGTRPDAGKLVKSPAGKLAKIDRSVPDEKQTGTRPGTSKTSKTIKNDGDWGKKSPEWPKGEDREKEQKQKKKGPNRFAKALKKLGASGMTGANSVRQQDAPIRQSDYKERY